MSLDLDFYILSSPLLVLSIGSVFLMLQSTVKKYSSSSWSFLTSLFFLFLTFFCSTFFFGEDVSFLGGSFIIDKISIISTQSILILSIIFFIIIYEMSIKEKFFRADVLSLFFMTILGMIVFVSSYHWVTMFVGLEMSSLGFYALVYILDPSRKNIEAAIKYFILGSVASALLLFGISFLYASSGSFLISQMILESTEKSAYSWVEIGSLLLFSGLLFKLAAAPFHSWVPDVYEASPTALTGFMATSVKVAIISVLIRHVDLISDIHIVNVFVLASALVSIVFGNIMGLSQVSLKRLIAYSSIAHSGYMLLALTVCQQDYSLGFESLVFYLISYVLSSVCFFILIIWLESKIHGNLCVKDLTGLAKNYPFASFALTVCLLNFAGVPPALGFFGKFFVFFSLIEKEFYLSAIVAALCSVVGLYFYLRLIVKMYMYPRDEQALPLAPLKAPFSLSLVALSLCFLIFFSILVPRSFFSSSEETFFAFLDSQGRE